MKFTFGIRAKITLLVIAIVALIAFSGPWMMSDTASNMVIDHELVDLADEATLRSWEMREAVVETLFFVEELVDSPELLDDIRRLRGSDALLESASFQNLLHLEISDGEESETLFSELPVHMPEGWRDTASQLRMNLKGKPGVAVSHILTANGIPYVCVCGRMTDGDERIISAFVRLGGNRNDPRHVMLVAEENKEVNFLMHPPKGPNSTTFWNEENFRQIIREMWDEAQTKERVANEKETAMRESGEIPDLARFPLEDRPPNIERIEILELPLDEPHFHFAEGKVGKALVERIAEEEIPMDDFFIEIQEKYDARIGGLANNVKEVRVLAPSLEALAAVKKAIEEKLTSDPLVGGAYRGIDWRKTVPCKTADIQVNRFAIDSTDGRKTYLLLYAAFREELAANVFEEVRELMKFAIPFALVAGVIAFALTAFFVRPLQKITKTAQSVTDSPNEALLSKIDLMTKSLPVERADEAGDIARALRRLFNEIRASHRQLDQRVRERTEDLEKANAELRTLDEAKDTFVANVSHELRNPLGTVNNSLQFLEVTDLDEEQDEYVRRGRRAAKTLLALINDLLAYQEIVLGGVVLNPIDVDLNTFLGDLHDDMELAASKNSNALVFDHPDDIGKIEADNLRLRQVLANLVGNSCKFTQNGTITLESKRVRGDNEEWIEFRAIDTGRGMTPEEQAKVFSLFYTNKEANQTGTGLGLPISQRLSNLMGGDIELESSEVGKGSTFLVRLPVKQKEEDALPAPPPVRTADGERPLILVIDDEESVRDVMKRQLTSQGYDVVEARSGEEGVELAAKLQPAAVTLDAVMPEVDGWEVLSRLKANEATASIPVVMVTFLNREAKGFALGADDYFTKPVDWNRLSHVLENLTDASRPRRILVVEDDESARSFLSRALAREGWTVEEAEHGKAALEIMEKEAPDAVVLDLMMPVMDGFEFLNKVQEKDEWENIPIIVVTAKAATKEESDFLGGSVDRVLQKGAFSYEELFTVIRQRFDRHHVSK